MKGIKDDVDGYEVLPCDHGDEMRERKRSMKIMGYDMTDEMMESAMECEPERMGFLKRNNVQDRN